MVFLLVMEVVIAGRGTTDMLWELLGVCKDDNGMSYVGRWRRRIRLYAMFVKVN